MNQKTPLHWPNLKFFFLVPRWYQGTVSKRILHDGILWPFQKLNTWNFSVNINIPWHSWAEVCIHATLVEVWLNTVFTEFLIVLPNSYRPSSKKTETGMQPLFILHCMNINFRLYAAWRDLTRLWRRRQKFEINENSRKPLEVLNSVEWGFVLSFHSFQVKH